MRLTLITRRLNTVLDYYSQFHPSILSIQQFLDFGSKTGDQVKSYKFLRQEVPVRLANIMKEIRLLPPPLLAMPSVKTVIGWYEQSFEDIIEFEKSDPGDSAVLQKFCDTLFRIRNRHTHVVETMAQGILEMKESATEKGEQLYVENQIQYFLDRFYMSRISIRMLINQHVMLFGKHATSSPKHIGSIDPNCDVLHVAKEAYDSARFLCEQYYLTSPNVTYTLHNPHESIDNVCITYVPSHLYHMLFELIKNAMRAVVEYYPEGTKLPPLNILICKGREDVSIKISDRGGGIPRSNIGLLFNYMYSTAPRPPSPDAVSMTPLAGYGYGLPISRLYAKYLNGDLWLSSMEGYGTDAFVYLKVPSKEACELLPVYNRTSLAKYAQSVTVADWSDPYNTAGLHGAVFQVGQPSRMFSSAAKFNEKPTRQMKT